jgi:hypothetical protein
MIMIKDFSKWVELITLLDKSSHSTSQAFLQQVLSKFGACADVPPSSLRDPKWVQKVGFAKMIKNLVSLPASSTKRGRGVVLEASGLD